jgi:hypothetical protein
MIKRALWYLASAMLVIAPFHIYGGSTSSPPSSSSTPPTKTMPTLAEDRLYKHVPFTTPTKPAGVNVDNSAIQLYIHRTHPAVSTYPHVPAPQHSSPAPRPAPQAAKGTGY